LFRVIRRRHVKKAGVKIRYFNLLEIEFLLVL